MNIKRYGWYHPSDGSTAGVYATSNDVEPDVFTMGDLMKGHQTGEIDDLFDVTFYGEYEYGTDTGDADYNESIAAFKTFIDTANQGLALREAIKRVQKMQADVESNYDTTAEDWRVDMDDVDHAVWQTLQDVGNVLHILAAGGVPAQGS